MSTYPKHWSSDFHMYICFDVLLYPHPAPLDGQQCLPEPSRLSIYTVFSQLIKTEKKRWEELWGRAERTTWWERVTEELKGHIFLFIPLAKGFKVGLTSKRCISKTFVNSKWTFRWAVPSERFHQCITGFEWNNIKRPWASFQDLKLQLQVIQQPLQMPASILWTLSIQVFFNHLPNANEIVNSMTFSQTESCLDFYCLPWNIDHRTLFTACKLFTFSVVFTRLWVMENKCSTLKASVLPNYSRADQTISDV